MASVATHNGLFTVISREMQEVEERLQAPVEEGEGLLSVVARYALSPGGKRIRPALLLLSAQACGADQRERGVTLAAAAEMMHAASLLHDDIVDHAATRRGRPSAMARWGSNVSVLVGDFLFSRAIQSLVEDPNRRILRAFADAVVAMSEAEVLQLHLLHDLGIGEADYLKIITGKTAALMSAACRAGALMADAPDAVVEALAAFGLHLGIGFQLVDDALDYVAREERLGKPVGSDFREGKVTYPVIQVVRRAASRGSADPGASGGRRESQRGRPGGVAGAGGALRGRAGDHAPRGRIPRPRPRRTQPRVQVAGLPYPPPVGRLRPRTRLVAGPSGVERSTLNVERRLKYVILEPW